jgi:hypothetical protein
MQFDETPVSSNALHLYLEGDDELDDESDSVFR